MILTKDIVVRSLVFIVGILILTFGISLFISSNLGLDPFTMFNMGLSNLFDLQFGTVMTIVNLFFIVIVFFVDKKYIRIGTILIFLLLGKSIDMYLFLIEEFIVSLPFVLRFLLIIFACFIIGLALAILISSQLGLGIYDMLGVILADKSKFELNLTRPFFDIIFIIIGILLDIGLGIGTFINMLAVGRIIQFLLKYTDKYVGLILTKFAGKGV